MLPMTLPKKRRAEDRTRTRDPLFTKQPLYQLSYFGAVFPRKAGCIIRPGGLICQGFGRGKRQRVLL